jgi:hypothetical protein
MDIKAHHAPQPFCTWEGTHAASAAAIETFLARTYELVPEGDEPEYMDFDAELTELLSQA